MKRDKPNRNFSGTPQGPRAYTPASVRRFAPLSYLRSGPAGCPWSFNLFFVVVTVPTKFFNFAAKHIRKII